MISLRENEKVLILDNKGEMYSCVVDNEGKLVAVRKMPYLFVEKGESEPQFDDKKFYEDSKFIMDFEFKEEKSKVSDGESLRKFIDKIAKCQNILFDIESLTDYLKTSKVSSQGLVEFSEDAAKTLRADIENDQKRFVEEILPELNDQKISSMFDDGDWMRYKGNVQIYNMAKGKLDLPVDSIAMSREDISIHALGYLPANNKLFYELKEKVEQMSKLKQN